MKNINFSYEGAEYSITFTPKEDYSVHGMVLNDKEISIQVSFSRNYVRVYKVLDDVFSTEDNLIHEEKLALNKVKASKFWAWYRNDLTSSSLLVEDIKTKLYTHGIVTLSVVDIFNNCPFIPEKICEFRDDQAIGYRPNEILFEDDITLTDNQKMYYYERDSNR